VDYIAAEKPNEKIMEEIGKGLNEGCKLANISLVGGETATLPDMIKGYDLSGTAIGIIKEKIITGSDIREDDVIFGIPSSGVHCNGITLVRKILEKNKISYFDEFENGKTIGDVLLTPTRIYIDVLKILKFDVHGLAHITGGGLLNLKRLKKVKFCINNPPHPPKIFKFIQELGNVDDCEMYRTFNMGIGFAIILPKDEAKRISKVIDGKIIGYVEKGEGVWVKDLRVD